MWRVAPCRFARGTTRWNLSRVASRNLLPPVLRACGCFHRRTMMTTWIGIGLSIVCLFAAEAALAATQVGPREAVESAGVRVMSTVQNGRPDAAIGADRSGEIRQIVREMFDFDEISRRAAARHGATAHRG